MKIAAAVVKGLRDKTGAGMMDCKKALVENDGDVEAAVDWLRSRGVAVAAKKAGRAASDGLVAIAVADGKAAIVEVNSETDFVARSEGFQATARTVAAVAVDSGPSRDSLMAAAYPGAGGTVADALAELVGKVGENVRLGRVATLSAGEGVVATYVHGALSPGLGRIGVLVALESAGDTAKLAAFGKQLAMHVAAARPEALTSEDVAPETLARERAVLTEQARASGKPENIVEKMVEGRLRKFFEDVVLLDQVYVIDGKIRVSEAVEQAAQDIGEPIRITAFVRFAIGEAAADGEPAG